MKVKELMDQLAKLPQDAEVLVWKAGGWEYDTWLEKAEYLEFRKQKVEWNTTEELEGYALD